MVGRPFPPMTQHLRVSVTQAEMDKFVAAFKGIGSAGEDRGGTWEQASSPVAGGDRHGHRPFFVAPTSPPPLQVSHSAIRISRDL